MPSLIGDVVERSSKTKEPSAPSASGRTTGFPSVQHRSKSEFAKSRTRNETPRVLEVPKLSSQTSADGESWHTQMEQDNERKVAELSPEERGKEIQDIKEQLGPGIEDMIKKIREAREKRELHEGISNPDGELQLDESMARRARSDTRPQYAATEAIPITALGHISETATHGLAHRLSARKDQPKSVLRGIIHPDRSSSTPPSARHLRFVEPGPSDIHVYDSAPSSPRRVLGLLTPPHESSHPLGEVIPRFTLSDGKQRALDDADEEGTPEIIRKRYFPSARMNEPSLEWMRPSSPPLPTDQERRYDLSGHVIPESRSLTLPTHLGLHHHSDPSQRAGYTLSDLLYLSRSSVASQRSTTLTVLARILLHDSGRSNLNEEQLKSILALGVEALATRNSVNVCMSGVEVVWAALMGKALASDTDGVPVFDPGAAALSSSLPLQYLLPLFAEHFEERSLSIKSQCQLLEILCQIAMVSSESSKSILHTDGLVNILSRVFLPINVSEYEEGHRSALLALSLFQALARSSRESALELRSLGDTLLRFIARDPHLQFEELMASHTLEFYAILGRYGLHSQLATTARELLRNLETYIRKKLLPATDSGEAPITLPHSISKLGATYFSLMETWIVCATNPHMTTPPHEIFWTQITAWGWGDFLLEVVLAFSRRAGNWLLTPACHALAAYLEGCFINASNNGESERDDTHTQLRGCFLDDLGALEALQGLDLLRSQELEPPNNRGPVLERICGILRVDLAIQGSHTSRSTMPSLLSGSSLQNMKEVFLMCIRSSLEIPMTTLISQFCCYYLRERRHSCDVMDREWLSDALRLLSMLPKEEWPLVEYILQQFPQLITQNLCNDLNIEVPPDFFEKDPIRIVLPFFTLSLRTANPLYSPRHPSTTSLKIVTAQYHPSFSDTPVSHVVEKQWHLQPLDHLLRSGSSSIFNSLPASWDATETQLVQASLFLTLVIQRLTGADLRLIREEALLQCMKVFMLEHGQHTDSSDSEVFRDAVVDRWMNALLEPYLLGAQDDPLEDCKRQNKTLEDVSKNLLGPSIPFYQFFSDLIGLYDAISFFHPLFGSVLLPLLSSRYPQDYRDLLLADYKHLLHTIKTPVEKLIAPSVKEFLYPVDTNSKHIMGYLQVLMSKKAEGFIYLMAVHHVAANIWPDLRPSSVTDRSAGHLLEAVVQRCDYTITTHVVRYYQRDPSDVVILPPACFSEHASGLGDRRRWLESLSNSALFDRLTSLLT